MKEKLNNFYFNIKKHLYSHLGLVFFGLIFVIIIMTMIILILCLNKIETLNVFEAIISNFINQILNNFIAVFTVIALCLQLYIMHRQKKQELDIVRKERTKVVSLQFANLLDNELKVISAYLKGVGAMKYLSTFNYIDFQDFDLNELEILFEGNEKSKNEFISLYKDINYDVIADVYLNHVNLNKDERFEIQLCKNVNWELPVEFKELINKSYHKHLDMNDNGFTAKLAIALELKMSLDHWENKLEIYYNKIWTKMLNDLEYMAIDFENKLSDEELIYQTIHQVYLALIKLSYGYLVLVRGNKKGFYLNIIHFYKRWSLRHKKDQRK